MKKKAAKVLNAILDTVIILVLIVSLTVIVVSMTAKSNKGVPDIFGITLFSVKTDSMEPTIMVGDIIIGRVADPNAEYEIGDVVTFETIINQHRYFNSHRIVEKFTSGGTVYYRTKGDNSPGQDERDLKSEDIVATWSGKRIPFIGGALDTLRSGEGYFIFLLAPVILFFIYCFFRFLRNFISFTKDKAAESAVKAVGKLTDEQKKQVIAEYIASQKNEGKEEPGESADAPDEENK